MMAAVQDWTSVSRGREAELSRWRRTLYTSESRGLMQSMWHRGRRAVRRSLGGITPGSSLASREYGGALRVTRTSVRKRSGKDPADLPISPPQTTRWDMSPSKGDDAPIPVIPVIQVSLGFLVAFLTSYTAHAAAESAPVHPSAGHQVGKPREVADP